MVLGVVCFLRVAFLKVVCFLRVSVLVIVGLVRLEIVMVVCFLCVFLSGGSLLSQGYGF